MTHWTDCDGVSVEPRVLGRLPGRLDRPGFPMRVRSITAPVATTGCSGLCRFRCAGQG